MIEPTTAAAAARSATAPTTSAPVAQGARSFASVLARSSADAATAKTNAAKADPRPDGEQTRKVAGHPYSRILNGDDKGLYLNQVAGNPRMGRAFTLVERGDHALHVYGTGKDRIVVDVPRKSTADTAATPAASAAPTTKS